MAKAIAGIIINEVETGPLSEYVVDYLCKSTKESPFLDFKKTIDTSRNSKFPEIAKDVFAFSNYGGGWMLLGWEEYKKNQFVPVGLPEDFELESAVFQEKFNSFVSNPIAIDYKEVRKDFSHLFPKANEEFKKKVNSISDRFGIIFIPPSSKIFVPNKVGAYEKQGRVKTVFYPNDVFYRRGTQSIKPEKNELEIIKKRLLKEDYRLSILSGEPDEIEETIYSNLFELKEMPKYVYIGKSRGYDDVSIKTLLKQEKIFPEFYYKFKEWSGNVVTFENLSDSANPYQKLVLPETVKKELLENWIKDKNKYRVIKEILNREITHFAIGKGLWYFYKKNKLYYPSEEERRRQRWKSRYSASTKTVASKFYVPKLKRSLFWHTAFHADIIRFSNKFYLRILPSFVISENGNYPVSDQIIGTIITSLSYNKYNSMYLNNVLFWSHQLGDGDDIQIKDYITISKSPVEVKTDKGIIYDIPSSEFKLEIEEEEHMEVIDDEKF